MYTKHINILCPDKLTIIHQFVNKQDALEYIDILAPLLTQANFTKEIDTNQFILTGKMGTMRTKVTEDYLMINASPPKNMFGCNYYCSSIKDFKQWVSDISDLYNLLLSESNVTSLEFGGNLQVNEEPEKYYSILGESGTYKKEKFGSLYYVGTNKKIIFYNKVKELKKRSRDKIILNEIKDKYILRIEIRLIKKVAKHLRREKVQLKDLYNKEFFSQLVFLFRDEYMQIHKNNLLQPTLGTMRCGDGKNYLLASLIAEKGANEVNEIVKQIKPKFTPVEHSRLKAALKNLKYLSEPSPLLTELDEKISELINNTLKVNF